jgi:hypothetical protein
MNSLSLFSSFSDVSSLAIDCGHSVFIDYTALTITILSLCAEVKEEIGSNALSFLCLTLT